TEFLQDAPAGEAHVLLDTPVLMTAVVHRRTTAGLQRFTTGLTLREVGRGSVRRPASDRIRLYQSSPRPLLLEGDRLKAWVVLHRPRFFANGGPVEHPPHRLEASLKSPLLVVEIRRGQTGWRRLAATVRHHLLNRLEEGLVQGGAPASARAMARAMLLGDRTRLDREDWVKLQEGGAIHVLAISGLHVTLLVGLFTSLLRRLGVGQPLRFVLQGFFLSFYLSLIPADPAPLRATVMGLVVAGARLCGRKTDSLSLLGMVALPFLFQHPALGTDPGFCLSYTVTGFLVQMAAPPSRWRSPAWRAHVASLLSASLIATAASLPLTAYFFGRCTPASILVNLVAVPAAMAIVCISAAATLLALIHPCLAAPLAPLLSGAVHLLLAAPTVAAVLPLGTLAVPRRRGILVLAALAALAWAGQRRPSHGRLVWAAVVLTQTVLLSHLLPPQPLPRGTLSLRALDVGQGDALLVGLPGGEAFLVDGGGTWTGQGRLGRRIVLPALHDAGLTRLAAVVLTHSHMDHGGGLRAVLQNFAVDELWLPSMTPGDALAGALVDRAVSSGAAVRTLTRESSWLAAASAFSV
ncbi:MAG: ComEC/Rec2 family competence protein, partial [Acidobacteriota bacterium]